jgi:hypothetical protein
MHQALHEGIKIHLNPIKFGLEIILMILTGELVFLYLSKTQHMYSRKAENKPGKRGGALDILTMRSKTGYKGYLGYNKFDFQQATNDCT